MSFFTFQSKQSKEFIELASKAIADLDEDTAKAVFKLIKNNQNSQWKTVESAIKCLEKKVELNMKICSYHKISRERNGKSSRVINSANYNLGKLLRSNSTELLHRQLERGFNLQKGTLIRQITPRKSSTPKRRKTTSDLKIKTTIPAANTNEYLQFLLNKALTSKVWSDDDADILCKCAISMQCQQITVHSMWVRKCHQLLLKYSFLRYQSHLQQYKKSRRRGINASWSDTGYRFPRESTSTSNHVAHDTEICVIVGHPLGETSTAAKVAETKQAVIDGAKRIRLIVSAGKMVTKDWKYIDHEIQLVVDAANGIKVNVIFPKHKRITPQVRREFKSRVLRPIRRGLDRINHGSHSLSDDETELSTMSSHDEEGVAPDIWTDTMCFAMFIRTEKAVMDYSSPVTPGVQTWEDVPRFQDMYRQRKARTPTGRGTYHAGYGFGKYRGKSGRRIQQSKTPVVQVDPIMVLSKSNPKPALKRKRRQFGSEDVAQKRRMEKGRKKKGKDNEDTPRNKRKTKKKKTSNKKQHPKTPRPHTARRHKGRRTRKVSSEL
eukprot:622253_1